MTHPYGLWTSHQVTSPIVGTVNLENARDINGAALPNTVITHPVTGDGDSAALQHHRHDRLHVARFHWQHAVRLRVYKPVADATKSVGYKFVSDGTKLWVASTPAAASRNIYTALPDGTMVAFTTANAGTLLPYL